MQGYVMVYSVQPSVLQQVEGTQAQNVAGVVMAKQLVSKSAPDHKIA